MPAVAVVTDTTHYAPHELVAAHDVREVSLYVNHGDRQQRETEITDYDAFYDELRAGGDLPTTSQPSIGDFLAVYEPLVAEGRDIVSVHIAGGISGTVESARQAAAEITREHPERRIEVVDANTGCAGQAYVWLAAATAAEAGSDVDATAAAAREAVAGFRLWFAVDTLEFLRRGGRIGAAQAWIGGALKIKPILTFENEIAPVERVRTSGRAFDRMVEFLRTLHADGSDAWAVQHVQAPDVAARMVDAGREIFGTEPLIYSEIGPVIGCHVGPGLLGVGGGPARLVTR